MSSLKRVSFFLALVFLVVMCFSSCKNTSLRTVGFKEVDFSQEQRIQLVTENEIYNISVSLNENGIFSMCFLDEAPSALKDLKIKIFSDDCEINCGNIDYKVKAESLGEEFLPLLIYRFLSSSYLDLDEFTFDDSEGKCFFDTVLNGRRVVFTIQLSLDKSTQKYILEIN